MNNVQSGLAAAGRLEGDVIRVMAQWDSMEAIVSLPRPSIHFQYLLLQKTFKFTNPNKPADYPWLVEVGDLHSVLLLTLAGCAKVFDAICGNKAHQLAAHDEAAAAATPLFVIAGARACAVFGCVQLDSLVGCRSLSISADVHVHPDAGDCLLPMCGHSSILVCVVCC